MESGELIRSMNQHTKPVHALAVRPGEGGLPIVASAAGDRMIRFWQPTIGRMVRFVRLESEPLNIVWTNDGARVLAACVDGHVRVIDPVEVTVTQALPAIDGWAYAIAMHPKDWSVAVAGTNGQIRRIELPEVTQASASR
jgi:WD40 repeat protein